MEIEIGYPIDGTSERLLSKRTPLEELQLVTNYASLGIKPVINATGNFTKLGGSLMPPEVIAAWIEASKHFVNLAELQQRVGERIAKLIGVEAALVTTGAAGAILLGTAAAVTRGDRELIRRFPETAGAQNEVILQRSHRSEYDSQLTTAGVKLVDVETAGDVDRVVNPRTSLMFFMNDADSLGKVSRSEWIALARRHQIPTLLDASADVPPVERMAEYCRIGFDMVAISGGKAMRGPNDTGLLLGRRELIEAARLNASPHEPTIGRMMKVGKEDLMALLAAVERFVSLDHKAEWTEMVRRVAVIEQALLGIPSIVCERIVPPIANHQPHLIVDWDNSQIELSVQQVADLLLAQEPPIQVGRAPSTGDRGLLIAVLALQTGEEQILADRLRAIFEKSCRID